MAIKLGAPALLGLLAAVVVAASRGAHGGTASHPAARAGFDPVSFTRAAALPPRRRLPTGPLLVARRSAVGPVAVDVRHVVAVVGPIEAEDTLPRLVQRELPRGPARTLARDVDPTQGLASTAEWVAYATSRGRLAAIRHDGSGRRILTRSLIAPLGSRGELVAWAESRGSRERVIVRDMGSGTQWVAADMPRCRSAGCYRIDAVTLANRGVVFTRGAIGPQPSFVVRRAFSAARPSAVEIPNDPQPDLAPSSAGALYYAFARGWYRWDFGRRPLPTVFSGRIRRPDVLRYENGRWLVLTRRGCEMGLRERRRGAPAVDLETAAQLRSLLGIRDRRCVSSLGVAWTGSQAVSAWAILPHGDLERHVDSGLAGLAVVSDSSGIRRR